jgi:hypothetical protein
MGGESAPNSLQPKFSTAKFGGECKGREEEEGEEEERHQNRPAYFPTFLLL